MYQVSYWKYVNREDPDGQSALPNPVIAMLGHREARQRANDYLSNVTKYIKAQAGESSTLEAHINFKLKFLTVWEQNAPAYSATIILSGRRQLRCPVELVDSGVFL